MSKLPIIGITMGDINSIATEVIIKTLADNRISDYCVPVVYGSPKVISYWKKTIGMHDFQLNIIKSLDQINHKRANILVCWEEETEIKPGEATEIAGKYAFKSLEMATRDAVDGKIQGIVTAPLNKHTVSVHSPNFKGHTEYLAIQSNSAHLMVLCSEDLKIALATGHVPVKDVSAALSEELIQKKVKLLSESLKKDFGIVKPRIAVLALNPHAGENGLLGSEETDIIIPAIEKMRNEGQLTILGPYPADGFFGSNQYQKFDGILAMYHDQGLVPFKYSSFDSGVNYTAGLPFVRTSPDHGTAYSLAGKNEASEQSMRNALFMAIDIWNQRKNFDSINENPLPLNPGKRERFRIDF
ncbi:MAG: 4-hydroxythreonine-4-phosphate dehydrogenase PdxA [Bacteroidia bacterium]|nr:4-hydroxythreonine-4-phosphate dehydrogenase PdxA [Bacteroidia bacterium]MCF8427196.1 4-hydroxythreonine-4-phosphate dehydrogenase PdxA [Bacteroidia bacterium]MCF8445415.1 4-hydroxythreonine-4-phosphate dehydrogenase PdxA [Bacteroidia bacterium]